MKRGEVFEYTVGSQRARIAIVSATRYNPGRATFAVVLGAGVSPPPIAVMVPTATPKPLVDKLNGWFNQVLATEETKNFLNSFGGDPFISTPDDGQALFVKQVKDWEGYVRAAQIPQM